MDSGLITELEGKAPFVAILYTVTLPGGTIRWTDGGFVVWGGNTYRALTDHGTISDSEEISDGIDNEATINAVTFMPADDTAFGNLSAFSAQGSVITTHLASIDFETGLLVGTPEELLRAEFDEPRLADNGNVLIVDCITEESRMLEDDDQRRLTDTAHQEAWDAELGLSNVSSLPLHRYWRKDRPSAISYSGGGTASSVNRRFSPTGGHVSSV